MKKLNSLCIGGNLTRDADIKFSPDGMATLFFSVAQNDSRKVQGVYQDNPMFFDCKMIGKLAETIHKYLIKGAEIVLHGELKQDRWIDKTTQENRSKVYIFCTFVQVLSRQKPQETTSSDNQAIDDDLPF